MRKNYTVFFLFLAIIPLLLLESCTIQKRRYMDGYYVQRDHPKTKAGAHHKGRVEVKFLMDGENESGEADQLVSINDDVTAAEAPLPVVVAVPGDTVPEQSHDTISQSNDQQLKHEPKYPEDPTLTLHPDSKRANTFAWAGWGTWVAFVIFASIAEGSFAFGWVLFIAASLLLITALIFAYRARRDFIAGTKYRGRNIARNVIITSWLFFIVHAITVLAIWLTIESHNINLTFGD